MSQTRSQTTVSPSLVAKTKPTKNCREKDFYLGIVGSCPCSDCVSFSLDSIPCLQDFFNVSLETCYSKTLKWKRTGDLERNAKQKCSKPTRDQSSSCSIVCSLFDDTDIDQDIDIHEVEMEAEEKSFGNHFSFDTINI